MIMPLAELQAHWTPIAPLFLIRNEKEYDSAVEQLNVLIDEIGTNQKHPLYNLLDTLGTLIHDYEQRHHVIPSSTGPEVLQFLMDEHGLSAADLPDLGPPEAVEQYLAGKEELSLDQVRKLAARFRVSPAAFI